MQCLEGEAYASAELKVRSHENNRRDRKGEVGRNAKEVTEENRTVLTEGWI